jgi:hypothetical protein
MMGRSPKSYASALQGARLNPATPDRVAGHSAGYGAKREEEKMNSGEFTASLAEQWPRKAIGLLAAPRSTPSGRRWSRDCCGTLGRHEQRYSFCAEVMR